MRCFLASRETFAILVGRQVWFHTEPKILSFPCDSADKSFYLTFLRFVKNVYPRKKIM